MARRHGTIELTWADGEHAFRLGIGQLRELQEKTGCGPLELMRRFTAGTWRVDDIRETLRIGLMGGGMKPVDALAVIKRYVDDRPLAENVLPAQAVLAAAVFGEQNEDEQPGEQAGRGSEKGPTVGSPSPVSTERVQ